MCGSKSVEAEGPKGVGTVDRSGLTPVRGKAFDLPLSLFYYRPVLVFHHLSFRSTRGWDLGLKTRTPVYNKIIWVAYNGSAVDGVWERVAHLE